MTLDFFPMPFDGLLFGRIDFVDKVLQCDCIVFTVLESESYQN